MIIKLVDFDDGVIYRGSVFRVRGKYPYEEFVDFMLVETYNIDRPYGLLVYSGYKAGLTLVHLTKQSASNEGGVDKQWIVDNWAEWVYPECDIHDVYYIDGYEAKSPI